MSKVSLIIPDNIVIPTTEALASAGVFHLTPNQTPGLSEATYHTDKWQELTNTFTSLEQRILNVMHELDIDEGDIPKKSCTLIDPDMAEREVERFEHEAEAPIHKIEEEQRRLVQLKRYIKQLESIAEVEVGLDQLRNLRYTFVMLGSVPITNLDRLRSSLESVPFVLVPLHQNTHTTTVMLFGLQRDAAVLNRAARSAYLNPITPPEDYRGTPAEAIAALNEGVKNTEQDIAECYKSLAYLHGMRVNHLRHLLWQIRASRTISGAIAGYEKTKLNYLVSGWVPTNDIPKLKTSLAETQALERVVIEVSVPQEEDQSKIPAAIKNPPIFRAFQGLVTNYGQPSYMELDPTPLLALTFPLIFGMMFGDVGHGIILLLLGLLLLSQQLKALKSLASMGGILVACGLASVSFGFLYGSIFGSEHVLTALWKSPMENIMDVLVAAIFVGIGIINTGMIINTINAALHQRWGHMIFDHNALCGIFFYWSLIGLVAGALNVSIPIPAPLLIFLAVVSGIGLTFAEFFAHLIERQRPLVDGDLSTYLMQAPFELFEVVITLLSNTLSYIRMGAFAVAHGALSLVVFILADMVSPTKGLSYWIVVVLGNLFVIGFEGMIVGIQTLRLEYYEFFSKFFSGNGIPYRPLTLMPKKNEHV